LHLDAISFLDAQRKIIEFRHDQKAKFIKETISIRIKARESEFKDPIDNIIVVDTLYRWNKYSVETSNIPHETREDDPNAIYFNITLSHNQPEKTIVYTVHYSL